MTDNKIEENAENWVSPMRKVPSCDSDTIALVKSAYIYGAHSRDEEIEKMKKQLAAMTRLKNSFAGGVDILDNDNKELQEELDKLRNPWISVKDRLPETGADIIYLMNSGTPGRDERYRKFDAEWFRMNVRHWQYANDPELKKG